MPDGMPVVALLATCFNRRETTLRGLNSLRIAAPGVDYRIYLVDDGSSDGTGEAVAADFPEACVIRGDGLLYWNGGMRRAWQEAIPDRPDYYLWWNDDLELLPDSVIQLLAFQRGKEATGDGRVISIGKVLDPKTRAVTYGGYMVGPGLSRLRFERAADDVPCDTMNGNFVLIPARAVEEIGIHSEHFTHSSGDIDYGLRARKAGYQLFQTPFAVGYTPYNTKAVVEVSRLTWSNRNFVLRHPKGLPVREWLHFCRTHGGLAWPLNFIVRYLKIIRITG